eukprot:3613883-Pleurochrysis_carterae.AAC.2
MTRARPAGTRAECHSAAAIASGGSSPSRATSEARMKRAEGLGMERREGRIREVDEVEKKTKELGRVLRWK